MGAGLTGAAVTTVAWLKRWLRPPPTGKLNLWIMAGTFTVFGVSMIFQPHRWESTPAYHVLLGVFSAPAWGALFLLSGVTMGAAAHWFARRWVVVSALTLAFPLTVGWMFAFVARYLTSPNTTPETWGSWAVFLNLLLTAAMSIDRVPVTMTAAREIGEFRRAAAAARAADGVDAALEATGETLAALLRVEEAFNRALGSSAPPPDRR